MSQATAEGEKSEAHNTLRKVNRLPRTLFLRRDTFLAVTPLVTCGAKLTYRYERKLDTF